MRVAWAWTMAMLVPTGAAVAETAGAATRDQAEVRSLVDGRLLYRESHYLPQGSAGARWVLYRCPDGKPFARKHVRASTTPIAPDFALEDGRDGYREGVRGGDGQRTVYAGVGGKQSARALAVPVDGVIDAGFDAAVRTHWPALLRGDAVELRFLVPSRKQFYPVRVQRIANERRETGTLRLRMRLATWFGFAIPDTLLVYGLEDRRLRVFSGTGNVRDANGRNPQVRIAFAPRPAPASADEIARIPHLPLDGRCPF